MLTPAQAHFQRTMAQRAGLTDDSQSQTVRTAHEQILHRLRLAQARLKVIQSKAAKAELKKRCCRIFPAGLTARWKATADARMR